VIPGFHPLVAGWFERRFGTPTEPQLLGWPEIRSGRDVLLSAPTGSGKTLAAFLSALDGLVADGATAGELPDATRVLYVSPLRALSNDIEKNLREPLAGIDALAREAGAALPAIRVAVRTGDTTSSRRAAQLARPPHVLVTTPESLYLLLTSERGRALLRAVRTVVCDEIHAVARDKRGAHLALSLERLEALAEVRPQRIGLSATQRPIEEIGRFLVGAARLRPDGAPDCAVIEVGSRRALDLAIEIPRDELSSIASNELWSEIYDRVAALVREHRTTLVFVNTRRHAERAAHALAERLGEGAVAAHHGSLSRARRLDAEERLKRGSLRCAVATASLELGIDVGAVDLVVQLGSPGGVATGLQRVGRAGHWRGATPKGRLFPTTRDELLECAALVRAARDGRIEETTVPRHPLDVLAQQLAAEVACGPQAEEALYASARRAWPYRDLPRGEFDAVVAMLAEGVATRRGRRGALLHRDAVHGLLRARRGARLAALTGGGAIPDTAQYQVVAEPEGAVVGQLDEDFAIESLAGDVFLLGNASWRIRRVEAGTVRVEDAHGAPPGVPFWNAEAPGRSARLSREVADLREALEPRLPERAAAAAWLAAEAAMPLEGARQAVDYLAASRAALGALPTASTVVLERFFDEAGGMQVVVHAPLGARTNRALGLALRKRFCRSFDFELQAAANDDGVLLSLGPQHSFPLDALLELVDARGAEEVLVAAALQSPMFPVRWRWDATRALALPRMVNGKRVPPAIARMRADDLLAAVFPMAVACQDNAEQHAGPLEPPDHPLVAEALRDCLHEAMDYPGLLSFLRRLEAGEVRVVARDLPEPSPLAHAIVGARPWAFLDDAPLEERRARAVALRRALPAEEAGGLGALDAGAIGEVAAQVWPDVRDEEELHDALLDLGLLPAADGAAWEAHLDALVRHGRAARLARAGRTFWVAAERVRLALAIDPGGRLEPALAPLAGEPVPDRAEDALARALRGWLPRLGPTTALALADRLALAEALVRDALLLLEREGLALRGVFLPGVAWSAERPHWCERGVLARIHRLTLGRLRREIEPVATADLVRFLVRWQRALPGRRAHGARGLAEVVAQLQGFHAAAGAWERDLLPARVAGFAPALLDEACLQGEVAWGRLAQGGAAPAEPRPAPTRAAPVTLALRADLPWLAAALGPAAPLGASAAALADALRRGGASFLGDVAAAGGLGVAEAEEALWEAVSAGAATCDGFAGLRALVDPARAAAGRRPAAVGGRWSLLARAGEGREALVEWLARQLLARWGVVFRDLLSREASAPPWRELALVYRRLEARGEIRGGRFAAAFSGEQFALPDAVDALRATRRAPRTGEERVELSAADPLNLVGILTPGARVPATMGNRVAWVDGVPSEPGALRAG
jgi:ATP-dependent Lhr-like helicase